MSWLERTELLIQKEGIETLKNAHILIVGLGGVAHMQPNLLQGQVFKN